MKKNEKNKKNIDSSKSQVNKKAEKILTQALKKLNNDLEKLIKKKKLANDQEFLNDLAHDIIELEEDVIACDEIEELADTTKALHRILEEPNSKNFNKTSLLDAAISLKHQDPLSSDLSHWLKEFTHYSTEFDNEYLIVFWSLLETLKGKKD
jgi:hypothetical protein